MAKPKTNHKKLRITFLIILTITALIVYLLWTQQKYIKGQVEEIIPVSQEIHIRFYNLKPTVDISEDAISEFSELNLKGAWLKMQTPSGRLYILRILPEAKYDSEDYFFVKTENKPDISRKPNEFVSQVSRDGYNYDMYLQYEDITKLEDINKIYAISPLKYEVIGNQISKRFLLASDDLNQREKIVIRNLPARAKFIDVVGLRKIGISDSNAGFWESDLGKLIPWLLLLMLLLLILFNWRRLYYLIKPIFMAPKKNLEEFGYLTSGQSGGDPIQFRSYLNSIYNGDLSDNHNSNLTAPQIGRIKTNIDELNKSIEDNKDEIEKIKRGESLPMFDPVRFFIALIIFIGLTIFSYFFYLSTINKALFVTFDCSAAAKLSILPSQVELIQAVQNSWIILIVPFTVFALGWILHIVFDNPTLKAGQRFLYLGAILSVTFFLDFLLASFIHKNMDELKEYCGYGTGEVWYLSTTFYIIIFMGFMVYIFWSMMLYYLLQQVEMRNEKRMIHNRSEKLRSENKDLQKLKERQIKILENGVGNVSGSVDVFHLGWNNFMSNYPERFSENQRKCEAIKNEFKEQMIRNNEL